MNYKRLEKSMRYCKSCVLPDTKPGIFFDSQGVCSACRYVESKKSIDWDSRQQKLEEICNEVRGSNGNGYDCVVPVSGGKDSMYQVYILSQVHKLKVLVVTVMAHLQTPEGVKNLNSLITNLGVDSIKVNPRPSTLKKIRRISLIKIGNPNYAEHHVVFAGVARAALNYGAPLIVWGEDIGTEFGGNVSESSKSDGSAEDLINNDLFQNRDFVEFVEGRVDENSLFFYSHPEISEIRKRNIKSIYLGYYHWWDGYRHYQIAKKSGFQPRREGPLSGNILDYDNIDEKLCELHIWFKFLKFGFWRPTDQCCYHIWNGYMQRKEAVELVLSKQYEFPYEYFNEFLEYHQITEAEFHECEERWRNHDIWKKVNGQWRLKYELE